MKQLSSSAAAILAAGMIFGGCKGGGDEPGGLVIERPDREERIVDEETGLVTRQFVVYRSFFLRELADIDRGDYTPKPAPAPFGDGEQRIVAPPQMVLERGYGIAFPEGTSATYDEENTLLTVVQRPDWMAMIEPIFDQLGQQEHMVNVRVEIYEVPATLALRLEQSASEHFDHAPELAALEKVVENENVRFVTSISIQGRSGQRSVSEAAEEITYFVGYEWEGKGEEARLNPQFEARNVGTRFEVDSVIGPDNLTVDLNFSIEHHTAPPTWSTSTFPHPKENRPVSVEIPRFHSKTMSTQIALLSGDTKLLGAWRPTGLPEFEENDVMRVVFIRADVQKTPIQ